MAPIAERTIPMPLMRRRRASGALHLVARSDQLAGTAVLTNADREQVTQVARQTIATFLAVAESNTAPPATGPKTEPKEGK